MTIPSEFVYIFIGSAFTLVVCTVAMLVSNNLLAPRRLQQFKKFNNAPIVINPHYVVSVDLIRVTSDVAVLQIRFHLTKESDKPSFGHDFENGQVARQAFEEIARYLEKP